jgi:hypothetical protein
MRTAILASAIILGLVSASMAMPVPFLAAFSNAVQAHGCHRYYAQDMSGWHRHDKESAGDNASASRASRMILPVLLDFVGTFFSAVPQD